MGCDITLDLHLHLRGLPVPVLARVSAAPDQSGRVEVQVETAYFGNVRAAGDPDEIEALALLLAAATNRARNPEPG